MDNKNCHCINLIFDCSVGHLKKAILGEVTKMIEPYAPPSTYKSKI